MSTPDWTSHTEQRISRRTWIKQIVAAGAAVSSASYLFRGGSAASAATRASQTAERLISLNVNGMTRRIDVLKAETLATTLRYKLGLTGTKIGCDRAECGNCTVLIDGVPHYSCSVLTHSVRDSDVLTIEGLSEANGRLHPIQQAFVDELGPQCGFCTPGQIMSTVHLLNENPNPSREEAAEALSGNLCRCGAYEHYLNSVQRAAEYMRG